VGAAQVAKLFAPLWHVFIFHIPGAGMNARMKIAFGCYLAVIASLAAWGAVFLLRTGFLPYHVVAAGMPWTEVPPAFQVLVLTFYKMIGGAWVVIATALLVLLLGPFRRGATWALRAIPGLILLQGAAVMNAMAYITTHSPATPPWAFTLVLMVLAVVGLAVSAGQGTDRVDGSGTR
jgi:peptidoglycan/LPS O-acetylase OafA/YrhL